MPRKIAAEIIGTAVLVFFGCAAAITNGFGIGFVGIALAFGLVIVAMAYSVGTISGGHFNPAVSLGCLLTGRMTGREFVEYILAQIVGAILGAIFLYVIFGTASGMGTNSYGAGHPVNLNTGQAFLVEVLLTFVFVLAILGVTAKRKTALVAGLVIGLVLTLVHLVGLPLTGTSVNPARSLAPALFVGGQPLHQLWLFIVAPLVGAALAAAAWRALNDGTRVRTDLGTPALTPLHIEDTSPWYSDVAASTPSIYEGDAVISGAGTRVFAGPRVEEIVDTTILDPKITD
jgi:aquaporin Z